MLNFCRPKNAVAQLYSVIFITQDYNILLILMRDRFSRYVEHVSLCEFLVICYVNSIALIDYVKGLT